MSIAGVISCVATLVVLCLAYYWERCRRKFAETAVVDLKKALEVQIAARGAERTGRIRAEMKLREQLSNPASAAAPKAAYPLTPIGHLQSCFSGRNGTPRQPLLARSARAKLVLRPDIPAGCLEGLEQYSHVWVLFIFHCNTNLQRLWSPSHATDGLKAKVQVPRLNGGRMGVLATRSPHRPAPIGLSVAEVIAVEGRILIVGGADIVDGSPVLDVKPYLPFCDSLPNALAPSWVSDDLPEDALSIAGVSISEAAAQQLYDSWEAKGAAMRELYPAFSIFLELIRQVLARDVRSVHQRLHGGGQNAPAHRKESFGQLTEDGQVECQGRSNAEHPPGTAAYQIVLQGIRVWYSISETRRVHVDSAEPVQ